MPQGATARALVGIPPKCQGSFLIYTPTQRPSKCLLCKAHLSAVAESTVKTTGARTHSFPMSTIGQCFEDPASLERLLVITALVLQK